MWFEHEVKPRLRGRAFEVRFADDAALVFEREEDARRVLAVLAKRFAKYGLRLHPEKTRLVDFRSPPRTGRSGSQGERSFDLLGFIHIWGRSRKGRWVVQRKTAKDRFTRALREIGHWWVLSTSRLISQTEGMENTKPLYHGYRFPPEIISHAVWLYHRFFLSFRDVEDLLAERGITVSYESIRQWCGKFGPSYARVLKKRRGRLGDTWFLDEVFIKIRGELHYLWRAVDQDGDTIDILMQKRRNRRAAKRFFRELLKGQCVSPRQVTTDKLRSYSAAHREVMPSVPHSTEQYENKRAEVSHEPTRQRERQMRRFKSMKQAQRFLSVHGVVNNLFRLEHHLLRACHYRMFRTNAFNEWQRVTCACST